MKNKHLFLFLAVALTAGSVGSPHPQERILADILAAFAWNIEHDGQQPQPLLTTASDVGYLFDEFGRRSTLGVSYKKLFAAEFKALGKDLAAAAGAGTDASTEQLTPQLRAELAAIFLHHSERLQ